MESLKDLALCLKIAVIFVLNQKTSINSLECMCMLKPEMCKKNHSVQQLTLIQSFS